MSVREISQQSLFAGIPTPAKSSPLDVRFDAMRAAEDKASDEWKREYEAFIWLETRTTGRYPFGPLSRQAAKSERGASGAQKDSSLGMTSSTKQTAEISVRGVNEQVRA
jgi:hypothetical protein